MIQTGIPFFTVRCTSHTKADVGNLEPKPKLIASEDRWFPPEVICMYSSSPLGFCFLVLLENCIIKADYMCPFVMLEKLQCCTSEF
jgi:hypothetical protein